MFWTAVLAGPAAWETACLACASAAATSASAAASAFATIALIEADDCVAGSAGRAGGGAAATVVVGEGGGLVGVGVEVVVLAGDVGAPATGNATLGPCAFGTEATTCVRPAAVAAAGERTIPAAWRFGASCVRPATTPTGFTGGAAATAPTRS